MSPGFVLAVAQRVNHIVRNRRRLLAIAHEMADADSRTDATPALFLPIDRNEEIGREQRRLDGLDAPGMTALLEVARQIRLKALTAEMDARFTFGARLGSHNVPAMTDCCTHGAASPFPLAFRRRLGTKTRSAPNRATAA